MGCCASNALANATWNWDARLGLIEPELLMLLEAVRLPLMDALVEGELVEEVDCVLVDVAVSDALMLGEIAEEIELDEDGDALMLRDALGDGEALEEGGIILALELELLDALGEEEELHEGEGDGDGV